MRETPPLRKEQDGVSAHHTSHNTQRVLTVRSSTQNTVHRTAHSTQHTAHSTQHTVPSPQYTVHSTQYTVHSTQYSTQYTIHSTVHSRTPYNVKSPQQDPYKVNTTPCRYTIQHTHILPAPEVQHLPYPLLAARIVALLRHLAAHSRSLAFHHHKLASMTHNLLAPLVSPSACTLSSAPLPVLSCSALLCNVLPCSGRGSFFLIWSLLFCSVLAYSILLSLFCSILFCFFLCHALFCLLPVWLSIRCVLFYSVFASLCSVRVCLSFPLPVRQHSVLEENKQTQTLPSTVSERYTSLFCSCSASQLH